MDRKQSPVKAGSAQVRPRKRVWSVHTGMIPIGHCTDAVLVFTDLFALALNPTTKFADWVAYRVTAASQAGRNSIARNWVHRYPEGTLEASDYRHSGYSMGHLCPLASVRADADAWQVNWTGSIAPQRQELNAGPWLKFEDFTRELARVHGLAMVAVGPLYELPMPPMAECDEPHTVPSSYWARVQVPSTSQQHAWIVPQSAEQRDPLQWYEVTADEVEARSGVSLC